MSRFYSYLHSAEKILAQYDSKEPFAHYLRHFFAGQKKYGSRDRKLVSRYCYAYFRLGQAAHSLTLEQQICCGLFLGSQQPDELLNLLQPGWNDIIQLSLSEKLAFLETASLPVSLNRIFPWNNFLSVGLDPTQWNRSFLQQPDLFIRIRPGKGTMVRQKLRAASIPFRELEPDALALPISSKLEKVLKLNEEAVIQDYSSQRTGRLLKNWKPARPISVWDCCAASGGKTILIQDLLQPERLTVSDIRDSILHNLSNRLSEAGIFGYRAFQADLRQPLLPTDPAARYELIVADLPCTGSGTWSRSPEQLRFFDPTRITAFQQLQQQLLRTIVPWLKPGGKLLYITCSVFKQENEEAIRFMEDDLGLKAEHSGIIDGTAYLADSLFAALLSDASA